MALGMSARVLLPRSRWVRFFRLVISGGRSRRSLFQRLRSVSWVRLPISGGRC